MELTSTDFAMILESLQYTKRNFENYAHYPSYQFKRERINEVEAVIEKVCAIQKGQNDANRIK